MLPLERAPQLIRTHQQGVKARKIKDSRFVPALFYSLYGCPVCIDLTLQIFQPKPLLSQQLVTLPH
jgi:hypothetical protein